MQKIPTLWKANAIVFIASFCVMVIELVAARILAPAIGVSLYTWTSIIGVILAGIALGNYLGGKVADRYASPTLLATILFAGTLATLLILPVSKSVTGAELFSKMHLMLNSTLTVACIFFIPAIILSMVSPMVIKLTLADLGKTGGVVGTIYACSTAGSILGTFMTGFFFVMWFGTRTTVWLVVVVLFLVGLLAWFSWKVSQRWNYSRNNLAMWILALLVILGSLGLLIFKTSWQMDYARESNYYTIQIMEYENTSVTPDNSPRTMKALVLDHLIHGYSVPEYPDYLLYEYLKVFQGISQYWIKDNPNPVILHTGGGSYSFPRYMQAIYPGSVNDVIEIDPTVTDIAYREMGLTRESKITTFNEDARIYLSNKSLKGKYDIVTGDCFNDLSTPYHLTTVQYDRMVKDVMKPGGVYLVNIIDDYYSGTYLPSILNTLKHAFKYVYVFLGYENMEAIGGSTFVIAATDRHIDLKDFKTYNDKYGKYGNLIHFREEKELEKYLAEREPILLTDDYAPTDLLVARLSRLRMERR